MKKPESERDPCPNCGGELKEGPLLFFRGHVWNGLLCQNKACRAGWDVGDRAVKATAEIAKSTPFGQLDAEGTVHPLEEPA